MVPSKAAVVETTRDLTILVDADCGFCSRTAQVLRRLDRSHRLALIPLTSAALPGQPSLAALTDSIHVVDASGRWSAGGDAVLQIASRIPLLRPLGIVGRVPGGHRLLDAGYRLVARNRHRLSRALGLTACRLA